MDLLRERLQRCLAPGQLDCAAPIAGLLGVERERFEELERALPVVLARLQHPVVVDAGQQSAVAERQCLVAAAFGVEAVRLVHVDPRLSQPDAVAGRHERVVAEGAPERPEGAAQACTCALVEDVRPEPGSDGRAWMEAGVEREPAEQRQRPPCGRRSDLIVDLDRHFAHDPDPHHRQSVQRDD